MSELARRRIDGCNVVVVQGDLTAQQVDAVVNAANEHLAHGGGVAAAIAAAAGPGFQQESDAWVADHGPIATGIAAVTGAGRMPATWIIHTVGPRYADGQDNEGMLRSAVAAALDAAADVGARTMAFPAISAGIFGYPRPQATSVIVDAIAGWAREHPDVLDEVRLVGFDADAAGDFAAALGTS